MIGQYTLIPEEAFLYFPQSDQIQQTRNKQKQRIIFCGAISYDPEENQKIQKLKSHVRKVDKNSFVLDFPDDILLRFLQATSFQNENCMKALIDYNKWQLKTLPLQITSKIESLLRQGILYVCGRDYCFRPIIVVNVGKFLSLKIKQNDLKDVLGFFFQFVIQNCLIEGQVQSWISIIDLNYESIFSIGGALMDIISFLSSNFRVRSNHSYLIKCPGSMRILWSMVKGVLNEDQIRKLTFSDKSYLKEEYFRTINNFQIQKKYGGKGEDISEFWPLKRNNYPVDTSEFKANLICEAQYNDMFQKEKLKNRKIKKALLKELEVESFESQEQKNTEKDEDEGVDEWESVQFPMERIPSQVDDDLPLPLCFSLDEDD